MSRNWLPLWGADSHRDGSSRGTGLESLQPVLDDGEYCALCTLTVDAQTTLSFTDKAAGFYRSLKICAERCVKEVRARAPEPHVGTTADVCGLLRMRLRVLQIRAVTNRGVSHCPGKVQGQEQTEHAEYFGGSGMVARSAARSRCAESPPVQTA